MRPCRKFRGAIAASLYGDLAPQDQRELDEHLEQCQGCRQAAQSLTPLAQAPVSQTPSLEVNLLTGVHARLRDRLHHRPWYITKPAWVSAFVLVLTAALALLVGNFIPTQNAAPVLSEVPAAVKTPVLVALADAENLCEARQFPRAYAVLREAIKSHPNDEYAGEAQARMADIAYEDLKWYQEAFDAYEILARHYPALAKEPVSVERRDILAEAREYDYAPLYALDTARRNESDQFAQLEKIVARYPQTFVASTAANEMAVLAAGDQSATRLAAMEDAKKQCTDPVAVARLELEIGHIYLRELNNPAKAKEIYTEAAANPSPVIAQLAKAGLSQLQKR